MVKGRTGRPELVVPRTGKRRKVEKHEGRGLEREVGGKRDRRLTREWMKTPFARTWPIHLFCHHLVCLPPLPWGQP